MAVATAAATTMANNAETARPRRSTAARTSIRRNIEVCGTWARLKARSRAERDILAFDFAFGPGALIVPLAAQTQDQVRQRAESPPHFPQMLRSRRSPESP